jgi:hypothetical protein
MKVDPKSPRVLLRDPWFRQNLQLARDGGDGSEAAKDILWKQYRFDFDREGDRYAD